MTANALRLRIRRVKNEHEEASVDGEGGELNLVPYLDIVTNIILFLMMTSTMAAALVQVPLTAAVHGTSGGDSQDKDLTVSISARGFTVATERGVRFRGGVAGSLPTIALRDGELDFDALGAEARALHESEPELAHVNLRADAEIPYHVVVEALDTLRGPPSRPLFPNARLAAPSSGADD